MLQAPSSSGRRKSQAAIEPRPPSKTTKSGKATPLETPKDVQELPDNSLPAAQTPASARASATSLKTDDINTLQSAPSAPTEGDSVQLLDASPESDGGKELRAFEADFPYMLARFKKLISLSSYSNALWTDLHTQTVRDYLLTVGPRRLVCYIDASTNAMFMSASLPSSSVVHEMMYFIRDLGKEQQQQQQQQQSAESEEQQQQQLLQQQQQQPSPQIALNYVTRATFDRRIQFGTIHGSALESLLVLMNGVYVPLFLENRGWPDALRKDFAGQLHKFMAFLTDTTFHSKGHTVLYVPKEDLTRPQEIIASKEVVQRLESLLVHWTRQIKEVINNQNTSETSENSGPLEEIQFWRSRCDDLSGIAQQLNRAEVQEIVAVLHLAKSSYLDQFRRLSNLIQEGSLQAQDNLKFLSTLIEPCKELAAAEPKNIAKTLPKLLMCVRLIWSNSQYYNTKERITSLLRKVSNEIIRRCCSKISLDEIFLGDVDVSVVCLQESINCFESWKLIYKRSGAHVTKYAKRPWDFDHSSIFAQVDAFIQRCRDLLEVCEGQVQFSRKLSGGKKAPIPIIGGSKGPDICKSLEDIEAAYERQLANLFRIKQFILDVKATRWHDDYNIFKQGIKDLEVMLQNVITSAFETATTVEARVELLDVFVQLAKRDAIKRTVERKAADIYHMYLQDLNVVKLEFENNRKTPQIMAAHPVYAGAAMWAKSLLKRVASTMSVIRNAPFLPATPLAEEVKAQFEPLSAALEDYIAKTHNDWVIQIPQDLATRLDGQLMARRSDGFLEINFDRDLLKLFAEIHYWQKLKLDIPYYVHEVFAKREELRVLRENVMLVVRDYNSILDTLSPTELLLFRERIRFLDRKISPGLTSLTWASKGITEYFVKECRRHSHDLQTTVSEFMKANARVAAKCKDMADVPLWYIEPKKIYDLADFEQTQQAHRAYARDKLASCHEEIRTVLQTCYGVFRHDGKDVQLQWGRFVQKIDDMVEDALRLAVKRSLLEIAKSINGESRSHEGQAEVQPLLRINIVLENSKVEFSPSLNKMETTINGIARELISAIAGVGRLYELLVDRSKPRPHFYDIIAGEDDISKIIAGLHGGLSSNANSCNAYVHSWDSYREIWEINKDAFIRRYAKMKPALSTFDADINRYNEVANNAQKEETLINISFTRLDCSPLKHAIVTHCHTWQSKLTTLLNANVSADLNSIHELFTKKTEKLRTVPADLDQLTDHVSLLAKLKADLPGVQAQFAPIQEHYQVLAKYEVPVTEQEQIKLDTLATSYDAFQKTVIEAEVVVNETKDKFKAELLARADDCTSQIAQTVEDFTSRGPFSSTQSTDRALRSVDDYAAQVQALTTQQANIHRGLGMFKIAYTPSKELEQLAIDIELLRGIWVMTSDWNNTFREWKMVPFVALPLDKVEETVTNNMKQLMKLTKDAKDWDVLNALRERFKHVKRIVPVLTDLRNPALRERHWTQLVNEIGKAFDPHAPDATLERVLDLGLDQYSESIAQMSASATKELSIEQGLAEIRQSWANLQIEVTPYKDDKYFKVRVTDDVFELLEDNQVTLSTMKSSKFYVAFSTEIDHWERTLARVVEVVELMLQVQKQWMYLENIFVGSEDIRKQLPKESAVFDQVNATWKQCMSEINRERNVLKATHQPNLLETLQDMGTQLEKIQRSLDMYLETKRQFFPRFYFLSNDDLLEILGQSKDPQAVQPHLRKCFDGITRLEYTQGGTESRRRFEAVGMHSSDGEYVPFHAPVLLEGPVEGWLTDVESAMRQCLKRLLIGCVGAVRKAKRDKWIKEWAGQLLILTGQITWTLDCVKCLVEIEKGEKHALKDQKKKQISLLKKLADMVRTPLNKVDRKKLIALITTEVHSRDAIDRMMKNECSSVNAFEWLSQLRFYWDKDVDDCVIRQTNTQFRYGYEYLGNSGRLVITPLTDRCYMTLTTALHLCRGGSPQGPAGTGKTETVKDLGKALGKYVIIQNCSEGLDYKSMGRMFSGLAQTGAWGCFDEFNRIDIEVLSVVALQISSVLSSIAKKCTTFVFEGAEIRLDLACGIFITMNPTYAGRVELPDNLKSLFRPVAMMVPDTALISEIMLFAEGFSNTRLLAKKVDTLYKVAAQQLSKQDHYDFGLRALTSALRAAGTRKRKDFTVPDEIAIFLTMKEMNLPKLTSEDHPLFIGMLSDLFPGVEAVQTENVELLEAIRADLTAHNLQCVDKMIARIMQFYETKLSRHSVMVVGDTGVGKSVLWNTLQNALTKLSTTNPSNGLYVPVKAHVLNPKAFTVGEMYGEYNMQTGEWADGVLSSVMRAACSDQRPDQQWVTFDGPVDTLWVESLNCFPEEDHQLLTSDGFKYLHQVEEMLGRDGQVHVACYRADGVLEYHPVTRNDLSIASGQCQLVDIYAQDGVQLSPTANHRMFAKMTGDEGYRIIKAGDMYNRGLADPTTTACFKAAPERGLSPHHPSWMHDPCVASLQLSSSDRLNGFLELYGYWCAAGWLREQAIVLACCDDKQRDYVLGLLRRLSLSTIAKNDESTVYCVTEPRWWGAFSKWSVLPPWMFTDLSAQQLRLFIAGFACATSSRTTGCLGTSCAAMRDALTHICLLAGYTAHHELHQMDIISGDKDSERLWRVYYSDHVHTQIHVSTQCRRRMYTGRVWCVTVPTVEQLIVFRRVVSTSADGQILRASRPLIVGNTVMDDNKVLTLINGERMALPEQVSLVFEVENLSTASPATVSRCGMIYMDYAELGWRPFVRSWLQGLDNAPLSASLEELVEKYLSPLLEFRRSCPELVPVTEIHTVRNLKVIFEAVWEVEKEVIITDTNSPEFAKQLEQLFLFTVIWSLGGSLTEDGRKKFDMRLREIDAQVPSKDTVFEYLVDLGKNKWTHWEEKLPSGWRYSTTIPFYRILVPTVDTLRNEYLFRAITRLKRPLLVVGDVGTGKTSMVQSVLNSMEGTMVLNISFSAQTSADRLQQIMESKLEKRTKNIFVPVGGKGMIDFLDDLNMPAKDTFGSQPALEFLRHWMDYGFCFDKAKQTLKYMQDISVVAAMGPPGGGRNHLSPRVQSRFTVINMPFPEETSLRKIFGTIISQKLQDFDEEVKPLGDIMTQATIDVFHNVVAHLLPTPTKMHYLFNLRDISRVFQGLLRSHKDYHDTRESLTKLWVHEVSRVFHDRLNDVPDKEFFNRLIDDKLAAYFSTSIKQLFPSKRQPIFGDFVDGDVYQEVVDEGKLRRHIEDKQEEYNMEPGSVQVHLVLFRDAIEHICRIIRVLRQPGGNVLLIGVGGSGRQSLTALAAYVIGVQVFRIKVARNYRLVDFREDLKVLYKQAGIQGKQTVFLFSDSQITNEMFLEDISNMLSSGEVPNLFALEDLNEIREAMRPFAKEERLPETIENLFDIFIRRVRNNMHTVLCLSPVGVAFRNRLRMFPALVNCTTIDWFSEWPEDALLEVSTKYLEAVEFDSEQLRRNVAKVFVTAHLSVIDASRRMAAQLKRFSYVTPINYLELVAGYVELLKQKKKETGDAAAKLQNGLSKLEDTKKNVQRISVELEQSKKQVAQFQKQCEDYLVIIVQQKREADEQAKSVSARSEKLQVEESEVKVVADAAQVDLDRALPALNAAVKALESLNKKDLQEIRSYGKPPPLVEKVMEAVMVLKKSEPTWDEAKRQLGNPNFIKQLVSFDKDNISDKILKRTSQYCADENFNPEVVGKVSGAAKSLCLWVRAMETYAILYRTVAPKREKLRMAQEQLEKKQATLREAKSKLEEIQDKLTQLQQQYDEKVTLKEKLKADAEQTELKLSRAEQLVSGLGGEKERWEKSIKGYQEAMGFLVGDSLLAAAFLSYSGPFTTVYRTELIDTIWKPAVRSLEIPCNPDFSTTRFLGKETEIREWNIQGLPSDQFSVENGLIVTRGRRWPLIIDPQGQAVRWIQNMQEKKGVKIVDLKQTDYLRTLETSIQYGVPVIIQGVQEAIDPSLDPILNKSIIKRGGMLLIRLGDKEVEYNPEFRLFLTTKLGNPHFSPEISAKTTIVNFAVKERGLEDQLLGIVVRKEKPELEEQKGNLVTSVANARRQLVELEDDILQMLSNAQGSLLDDEKLVNALKSSKTVAEQVTIQLQISEQTEVQIDAAREGYRPSAQRASVLYFVLNDLSNVDPMYQFSLDSYIDLFVKSIAKSRRMDVLAERIASLNDYHTYAVYKYACRGLFERDKLLFAFQMTAKILTAAGKLSPELYDFFLRGGQVLDREAQMPNPCTEWINEVAWDNLTELEKLPGFQSLVSSLEQNEREWRTWYTSPAPEELPLPGEWNNKLSEFQKMLIVRSLRTDRVIFSSQAFVASSLGQRFTEPPILDMMEILQDSTASVPLVFVLSPGVDPTIALQQLAVRMNLESRFNYLSLGQGQAPKATRLIQDGMRLGNWVFLANCHLSISWMPQLEKIVEVLPKDKPHPDFRLWLSSSPHPKFPIAILHSAVKMTTEPPKGLKSNMMRLYGRIQPEQFERCTRKDAYKKLVFALCFYHSTLLERRKFLTLGWNTPYDFNDADFDICENIICNQLDEYQQVPWDAMKYLIAEANYGGRVTDDWDRRVLRSYINSLFCDEALTVSRFKLSSEDTYFIPEPAPLQTYRDYIQTWPSFERPEAFGQHANADIASQIKESSNLLETLFSLQPQTASGAGASRENTVLSLAADMIKRVPEDIDYEYARKTVAVDMSPTNVVLLQEIRRYNALLQSIRSSLAELQKGIRGIVVMSPNLEEIFACMFEGRIPPSWSKTYPSLKALGTWMRDLAQRIEFFAEWSKGNEPKLFWLSAFSFPTGFLTAVLQNTARKNNIAIDILSWEFTVLQLEDESHVQQAPKDGIYVRGIYLEGAGWDKKANCLKEPHPMELITSMPPIHFRPVENKKKLTRGLYPCPVYYYPIRAVVKERQSFVIAVDLKTGTNDADYFVKRGTACLLSTR
ncbi:hypothetical protein RI367_000383 [Sorochytrium milnesiophthora]